MVLKTYYFSILIFLTLCGLSCVTIEKVKTGEQAIERKQYAVAQKLLLKEFESAKGGQKAEKAYLLGDAYSMTNQSAKALTWYLKSEKLGIKSVSLFSKIAYMYKQNGEYTQAIQYFQKISGNNSKLGADAARERDICRQALEWNDKEVFFDATLIKHPQNASVYFSAIDPSGKLVITSDHKENYSNKKYKWTGRFFSGLHLLDPIHPDQLEKLPGWKNQSLHQGSATFNADRSEMVYTLCDNKLEDENYCHLFSSIYLNEKWQEGRKLNFIKPGINYGHPFIHQDSTLFFASNDPKGFGGYDLYFSRKTKNGNWGKSVHLPTNINTEGNEKFPTVFMDTLYFSSDYLPGLGGLDIFKIFLMKDGNWSAPHNMHKPVNSSSDDFGIQFAENENNENLAYFNSSRENPEGFDKIFSLTQKQVVELDSQYVDKPLDKKNYQLFLSLRVIEKVLENEDNPNSRVIGKRAVQGVRGTFSKTGQSFVSRLDGRHIQSIEFDSEYSLKFQKDGYLQNTITIPAKAIPGDQNANEIQTISIEVEMSKPYLDKEIVLHNIYYDLDKWEIRDDAIPTLEKLFGILNDNPTFNILIGAHTDCRADEEYNFELSEKRALSVVNYLVKEGIEAQRLSSKGHGKSKLLENCICEECTENQHQKNRRTTFILSK